MERCILTKNNCALWKNRPSFMSTINFLWPKTFSLLLRRLRHAGNSFQFCFDFDSFTVVFQLLAGNLLEQSGLGNSFPREGNFPSLILLWPWRISRLIGAGIAICIALHGAQLPQSNFAFNYKKKLNNFWQSFHSRSGELNRGPLVSPSCMLSTELW